MGGLTRFPWERALRVPVRHFTSRIAFALLTCALLSDGLLITPANAVGVATISGIVTAAASGAGLAGICVDATSSSPGIVTTTAADGTYTISGLAPGSYMVMFGCGSSKYVTQYYNGTAGGSFDRASAVTLSISTTTVATGIDAAMVAPATISGTVTSAVDGSPLGGVCVDVVPTNRLGSEVLPTAADGTYTAIGLAPGHYTVEFLQNSDSDCYGNYVAQWYNGTASGASYGAGAVVVATSAASPVVGINAAMTPGGSISGTVTAAAGGAALAGICVGVVSSTGITDITSPPHTAYTASNGTYTIGNLAAGSYFVTYSGGAANYVSQYYDGITAGASQNSNEISVPVTTGVATTGIDHAMISGNNPTGPAPQSPFQIITLKGTVGHPLTLSTRGGSGTGSVTFSATDGTAKGCKVSGHSLISKTAGTCVVVATKSADPLHPVEISPRSTFSFALPGKPAPVTVRFRSKSYSLSASAQRALRALSKMLLAGASIAFTGYARGDKALAMHRAALVAKFLTYLVGIHVTLKAVTRTTLEQTTVVTTKQ